MSLWKEIIQARHYYGQISLWTDITVAIHQYLLPLSVSCCHQIISDAHSSSVFRNQTIVRGFFFGVTIFLERFATLSSFLTLVWMSWLTVSCIFCCFFSLCLLFSNDCFWLLFHRFWFPPVCLCLYVRVYTYTPVLYIVHCLSWSL